MQCPGFGSPHLSELALREVRAEHAKPAFPGAGGGGGGAEAAALGAFVELFGVNALFDVEAQEAQCLWLLRERLPAPRTE